MQDLSPPSDFFLLNRDLFDTELEFENFKNSLNQVAYKSVRLNNLKTVTVNPFDSNSKVSWLPEAKYVDLSLAPSKDINWYTGAYYVQEAASMILANFIDKKPNQKILDLCAAPGGKTTLVASVVPKDNLIFANEVVTKRVHTLKENLKKAGASNILITQNQAKDFANLGEYFEVVFVDAPCSGEGLCRKNPDIWSEWSIEVVKQCALRQTGILDEIAPSVKLNGQLIYSTCTFNTLENEEVIKIFLENHPEFELETLPFDPNWGLTSKIPGCFHLFPSKVKGEGLFIATLRKVRKAGYAEVPISKNVQNISPFVEFKPLQKKLVGELSNWLLKPSEYNFFSNSKEIFVIPKLFAIDQTFLAKTNLRVHDFGLRLGTIKGTDFIPSQDLALFSEVSKLLDSYDLTLEQAKQVIAGEPLDYHDSKKTSGWLLLKYNGLGLCFGKIVGSRINTYFEKS